MAYDAFISYSHAADGRLAPALQRGLRSFARPWYKTRALKVFRDKTSLSASPQLWGSIERALASARYFILLASPEAAESDWVGREVSWWREHRSAQTLLLCATDGEIHWDAGASDFDWRRTTALPRALAGAYPQEPLYADLSWARQREHLSRRDARFQEAVTMLAATIHGRPMEEMAGEDVRQHRRTRMVASAAIAAIVALAVAAETQRRAAVAERDNAVALVGQIAVNNGLDHAARGDDFAALAWFVNALRHDHENPGRERRHRVRIGLHARALPRLVLGRSLTLPVTDVRFSPDGRRLAVATGVSYPRTESEGSAQILDARTGEALTPPLRHDGTIYSVRFSPDGTRILTAGGDGRARVWDAGTGALLLGDIAPGNVVRLARFSPDGRLIATAGRTARVWDARTGRPVTQSLGEPDLSAWHVAFSPDGDRLLATFGSGYLDGAASARIWDIASGKPLTPAIGGGGKWTYSGAFSPDGSRIVLAQGDGTVQEHDAASGAPRGLPVEHGGRAAWAAFDAGGAGLISAGWDGVVRVSGARARSLAVGGEVREIGLSPDGRLLVAGSSDGHASVWDLHTGRRISPRLRLSHRDYPRASPFEPGETPGPEFAVTFAPDGRRVATGGWDGTLRVWDLASAETVAFTPGEGPALPVAVPSAPDADAVEIVRTSDAVRVRERATGRLAILELEEPARTRDGHSRERIRHLYSPDGRWLLIANTSILTRGWLFLIDAVRFEPRRIDLDWPGAVTDLAIGPRGERVYVVFGTEVFATGRSLSEKDLGDVRPGQVRAWNLDTGQAATPPFEHSSRVRRIVFDAPRGRLIGTWDTGLQVWEARSGKLLSAPIEHEKSINRFVLSADGTLIATASRDTTARIWDAASGVPRTPPLEHPGAAGGLMAQGVVAIAFHPDTSALATGSAAPDARIWDIATAKPLGPPLPLGFIPRAVDFDPSTETLVVEGAGGARHRFDLRPTAAPVKRLALLVQALGMRRFDETEVLVAMDGESVHALLPRIRGMSGLPSTPTLEHRRLWHQTRAAMAGGYGFAADARRFHLLQAEELGASRGR